MNSRRFLCTTAAVVFGCTSLPARADYVSEVLAQGPLTYWRFGETAPFQLPDNVATNLGTLGAAANASYSAQEVMKGQPSVLAGDTAAACDGAAGRILSVPFSPGLNPSGPFSAEGWFKPDSIPNPGDALCCFASAHEGLPRSGWHIYQGDEGWSLRMFNQSGSWPSMIITSWQPPVPGTWYHLMVTWDGTVGRLYVNGVPATSSASTFVGNVDGPTTIGQRSDGLNPWSGMADEVAIYTNALSDDVVAAHYAAATTNAAGYAAQVLALNPVLYLRLDEPIITNPLATNLGSLGPAGSGIYRGGLVPLASDLIPPSFPGLEETNRDIVFDGVGTTMNIDLIDVPPPWTTVFWVKREDAPGASAVLLNSSTFGIKLEQEGTSRLLGFTAYSVADYNFNYMAPADTWVHLALVGTAEGTTLYVNGAGQETNQNVISLPLARLGDLVDKPKGALDELATFNRALLAGQIKTLYLTAIGDTNGPTFVNNVPTATPAGTIYATTTFSLDIDAYGAGPLAYQWIKDGALVCTNPTYVKTNASSADKGAYQVVVTNAYGSITSATINLTVQPAVPPAIDQPPVARSVYAGGTTSFSVAASGTAPLMYHWKKDGTAILGASNQTFTITNVSSRDVATYSVAVTNVAGGVVSSGAALTLRTPAAGSYEAAVAVSLPLAYWRLGERSGTNAFDYAGGHDGVYENVTLGLPGFSPLDPDTCVGFDPAQPGDVAVAALPEFKYTGARPTFSLETWAYFNDLTGIQRLFSQGDPGFSGFGFGINTANGLRLSTYGVQNFDQSLAVPLVTNTWYHIAGVANAGGFYFYVNGQLVGSVAFTSAGVSAEQNPPFELGRNGLGTAIEAVNGRMDEAAVYDRALSGDEILAHYSVGQYGTITLPFLVKQPSSEIVTAGGQATLSVLAAGSSPLSYQWNKEGVAITGATNSTLIFPVVGYADAGAYSIMITNAVGATNSAPAILTVRPPPAFANLTNGLVLHLKFDGTYTDSSGLGHDATAVNSPTFVPGKLGQGVKLNTATPFNEFNYLTISGSDFPLAETNDLTVAVWLKYTIVFNDLPVIGNAVYSTYQPGLVLTEDTGRFEWTAVGVDTGWISADPVGGPLIADGVWHNVAVALDRAKSVARSYVDGVLVDSRSIAGLGTLDTGNMMTMGQDPTGTYAASGEFSVDDLGMWARALDDYDVLSIYNAAQFSGQSFDVFGPVKLFTAKAGADLFIAWQAGTLESADELEIYPTQTVWSPVAEATPPTLKVTPGTEKKFYRVRQ